MIIAHMPAGYLFSTVLQKKPFNINIILWAALLGSIFPDFDIIYFYLIDDRTVSHRKYITHLPFFWACITVFVAFIIFKTKNIKLKYFSISFLANVWLHLCLDTVMAPVYWLKPFSDQGFKLLTLNIDIIYDYWLYNYMLHPIFLLELSICLAASICFFFRNRKLIKLETQRQIGKNLLFELCTMGKCKK